MGPARHMLGFEWQVAVRFLLEGRRQTLLIVAGVAAGVAVVAYISALVTGLQSNTLSKTLGAQAHVSLRAAAAPVQPGAADDPARTSVTETQARAQRARTLVDWQSILTVLERHPGVASVSPLVSGSGLALKGQATQAIALSGIDLDAYDRIVGLKAKIISGPARLQPGEALVGRELAADFGLRVGDRLSIQAGTTTESVRVGAIVDLGVRELNRRSVFVPLRTAQSLLGLPGGVTALEISVRDVWSADALADEFRRQFPAKVESWQEANAQLVSALNAQSVSTGLIRGVVLVVVVLGITSVLVVSVVQKRREIGILRAMGSTRQQVLRIFLIQGALIGASGSALGVVFAVILVELFTRFVRGADGLPLFVIHLTANTALQVAAVATVCGVLAALAPARSAAALDPAQAIRM